MWSSCYHQAPNRGQPGEERGFSPCSREHQVSGNTNKRITTGSHYSMLGKHGARKINVYVRRHLTRKYLWGQRKSLEELVCKWRANDRETETWSGMRKDVHGRQKCTHETKGKRLRNGQGMDSPCAENLGNTEALFYRRHWLSDHPRSDTVLGHGQWPCRLGSFPQKVHLPNHRLLNYSTFTLIRKPLKDLIENRGFSYSSLTPEDWLRNTDL